MQIPNINLEIVSVQICVRLFKYIQCAMYLLTVLQHLHDVLFDHWQNDLSSQTTGNSVQSTFPSHSITDG